MRVLVTGGAGFLGSHVVERLLAIGDHVLVVDDLSTGRAENLSPVTGHPQLKVEVASILAPGLLVSRAGDVDAIVHLAAAVGVARVIARPADALERNVEGTLRVVDAAVSSGARVLYASSSEVYGLAPRVPASEDDPLLVGLDAQPRWGYARSKLFGELQLSDVRTSGAARTLSVRLFNTVGPRQVGTHGMVLPRFVDAALNGTPLVVHGDGSQRRSFAHVEDVATALVDLLHLERWPEAVVNVGGTAETRIDELARRVLTATGSDAPVVYAPLLNALGAPLPETPRRIPDLSRLESWIGARDRHGLERIVRDAISTATATSRAHEHQTLQA